VKEFLYYYYSFVVLNFDYKVNGDVSSKPPIWEFMLSFKSLINPSSAILCFSLKSKLCISET